MSLLRYSPPMQTEEAVSLRLEVPPHVQQILREWTQLETMATPEEVLEALAEELTVNPELRAFAAGLVGD
jgi:hypothetical protein